jgi:hypothetical protein
VARIRGGSKLDRLPRLRTAAWAAALLTSAALAGCGELGADFRGTKPLPSPPPSPSQIDRLVAGSPERTLLQWCRDLKRTRDIRTRWVTAFVLFRLTSCPRIVDVMTEGDRATAYTILTTRWIAPNGRVDAKLQPQAFHLVRDGRAWSVVDDRLMSTAGGTEIARDEADPALPRLVNAGDIYAKPPGSAERAALRLLRALQFNDPLGAAPAFAPAWRLSPRRIARYLRANAATIRSWGLPRIVAVRRRGPAVEIVALPRGKRHAFVFRRRAGRWQLVQVRTGALTLPRRAATSRR